MTARLLLKALSLSILAGCASEPPVPPPAPPTIVNVNIESGADVNADIDGNGSPVMLRIFELREQSNFTSADFFDLFDKASVTLGSDSIRKQELLLKPGDNKQLTLKPDDDARSLGVFAAFRQLDTAQWRATADIVAHRTQNVTIKLNANRLSLETKLEEPKPEPEAED